MGMSISENWRDSLLSSDIAEICQGFVRPTGSGFPTLRCCQAIIAPLNHGQPSLPLQATGLLSPWTSCPGMSRILTWPPSHHHPEHRILILINLFTTFFNWFFVDWFELIFSKSLRLKKLIYRLICRLICRLIFALKNLLNFNCFFYV